MRSQAVTEDDILDAIHSKFLCKEVTSEVWCNGVTTYNDEGRRQMGFDAMLDLEDGSQFTITIHKTH